MNPCYSTINSPTKRLRPEAFFKRKLLSLLRFTPIIPLKPLQSLYKVPEILQGLVIANRTIVSLYGPLVSPQGHSLARVDAILAHIKVNLSLLGITVSSFLGCLWHFSDNNPSG